MPLGGPLHIMIKKKVIAAALWCSVQKKLVLGFQHIGCYLSLFIFIYPLCVCVLSVLGLWDGQSLYAGLPTLCTLAHQFLGVFLFIDELIQTRISC